MSSTAFEVMMKEDAFQAKLKVWIKEFDHSFIRPCHEFLLKRIYLQRPFTDDMFQMLQDLGIEPPEFQPVSYNGLTFKWRR